jgi:hypothetical protein
VKLRILLVVLSTSCGGPLHQIVEDSRNIREASGAPEIRAVNDIGGADVPMRGDLVVGSSDGVATIGETLWIRGGSFGRQPSVLVGGRPAAVLGRTRDGGVVVRVPPATAVGPQPVTLSNEMGKAEHPIAVRRYGAVLPAGGGQIAWVEMTSEGPIAAGTTEVPGARLMAMSADGRAVYVSPKDQSLVQVIEVPAAGGPKRIDSFRLDLGPEPVTALVAATRAGMLAVVRKADIVLVDISSPLRPARSAPRALAPAVRDAGLAAVDLSPDGKYLAAVSREGNRVMLLDLVPRGQAPLITELQVLPEVRVAVLLDVAFSPDGQTLWVLAGNTAASRPVGPQPTQVFAVRLTGDARSQVVMSVARGVKVDSAVDPVSIGTGRGLPLVSGAAIRLPPERSTIFLTARQRQAGAAADDDAQQPTTMPTTPTASSVFRIGAEDAASEAATAQGTIGTVDVSPDGRWLLAAALGRDGTSRLLSAPADARPGESRSLELPARKTGLSAAAGSTAGLTPPEIRVQP